MTIELTTLYRVPTECGVLNVEVVGSPKRISEVSASLAGGSDCINELLGTTSRLANLILSGKGGMDALVEALENNTCAYASSNGQGPVPSCMVDYVRNLKKLEEVEAISCRTAISCGLLYVTLTAVNGLRGTTVEFMDGDSCINTFLDANASLATLALNNKVGEKGNPVGILTALAGISCYQQVPNCLQRFSEVIRNCYSRYPPENSPEENEKLAASSSV